MPIFENQVNVWNSQGEKSQFEQSEAKSRLSSQAFNYAALGAAVLTAAILVESKGNAPKLLPALIADGKSLSKAAWHDSGAIVDDLALGGKLRPMMRVGETAASETAAIVDMPLAGKALTKGETAISGELMPSDLAANIRLGANPAPEYAARSQPVGAEYLNFTSKWPVEGVNIHDQGVNLVVTRNGHWVKLENFDKPTADVHGIDILNTRIGQIRTWISPQAEGGSRKMTSVVLEMGRRDPIELIGQVKATEFWY